ncbi:helix-turn-helix transcriptional regulator [Paenibacillus sp. CC-CFT747]|nr:helix-turn-helix transcriptional regulator [Paenibacillus sp. CC-CFT747]
MQRVYKRVTGRSPAEQLQRVRLQEAKRLLGEGKLSMAEIGSAIGFRSASHMAQWFRRETGRTPTEYREGSLDSRGPAGRSPGGGGIRRNPAGAGLPD